LCIKGPVTVRWMGGPSGLTAGIVSGVVIF
jgi:hypothetical protein